MKVEGQFAFENTPSHAVWAFLTDPDRIASCLPGCEKLVPTGDGSYDMTLSIGVGAIRGKFGGSIRLHDVHPTTDYAMTVAGLFLLRIHRPNAERPYRAIGYPWLPATYVILCSLVMLDLLIVKPLFTWPGLCIVLTGIPVYLFWHRRSEPT